MKEIVRKLDPFSNIICQYIESNSSEGCVRLKR